MAEEHKNTLIPIVAIVVAIVVAIGTYVAWTVQERKVVERREGFEMGKGAWVTEWMGERDKRIQSLDADARENRGLIIDHLKWHGSK